MLFFLIVIIISVGCPPSRCCGSSPRLVLGGVSRGVVGWWEGWGGAVTPPHPTNLYLWGWLGGGSFPKALSEPVPLAWGMLGCLGRGEPAQGSAETPGPRQRLRQMFGKLLLSAFHPLAEVFVGLGTAGQGGSGVPQGWALGPAPLRVSIASLGEGISWCAGEWGRSVGLREGGKALQRGPGRLERWAEVGRMRFHKAKVLQRSGLGEERLESRPVEKDLGVLVDSWLDTSQQCGQGGQQRPGV